MHETQKSSPFRCAAAALALGAMLAAASAPLAFAQQENDQSFWDRPTLTGDWGGARTALKNFGITPFAEYTGQLADAFAGGRRQGAGIASQLSFGFNADLAKIVSLPGASLHVTFNLRGGRSVIDDYTDADAVDKLQAQGIYGAGENLRLSVLEYEQKLFDNRINLRLGFFSVGNSFGDNELLCDFSNVSFCAHPQILPADSGWTDYPTAKLGGVVKLNLRDDLYFSVGVFDADDNNHEYLHQNGFRITADGSTGTLIPWEIGYTSAFGPSRLVGHYKLGGWYDSSDSRALGEAPVGGVTPDDQGRYGVYFFADQMVWNFQNGTKRGLILFGQASIADRRTALFTDSISTGFIARGIMASRPADYLAIGYTRGAVNDAVISRDLVTHPGASYANHESVLEAGYGVTATPWLVLYPNFQYYQHPDAFGLPQTPVPNAYLAELEAKVKF